MDTMFFTLNIMLVVLLSFSILFFHYFLSALVAGCSVTVHDIFGLWNDGNRMGRESLFWDWDGTGVKLHTCVTL